MNSDFIRQAFDRHDTDKGRDHQYEHMYSAIFERYNISSLLEIGVEFGKSIAVWKDLFPNAVVAGIDIAERDLVVPKNSFDYIIGDSGDREILSCINRKYDIIIDDASNDLFDQALTFENFKDIFNYCYVIEDIYSNRILVNDRIDVLEKSIKGSGFYSTQRYVSHKKRNGVPINTMALIIYRE